jgi:hypothetical protein
MEQRLVVNVDLMLILFRSTTDCGQLVMPAPGPTEWRQGSFLRAVADVIVEYGRSSRVVDACEEKVRAMPGLAVLGRTSDRGWFIDGGLVPRGGGRWPDCAYGLPAPRAAPRDAGPAARAGRGCGGRWW